MTFEQNSVIASRSFLAGILIGIGAVIYTHCNNIYLGAFLFSFGLLSVINLNAFLYTGRIGYFNFKNPKLSEEIIKHLQMLIYNFIGIGIIAIMNNDPNNLIFLNKLETPLIYTFGASVLCGVLMYIAVELWKKTEKAIFVIMPIMIFILSGFDHCIANMYFFLINPYLSLTIKTLWFFIINILGNTIGSLGIRFLINRQ